MALQRPITSTLRLWFILEAHWSHFWRLAWTFIRPLRRDVSECHLEIYQFALYQQSLFGLTMLVYLIKAKIKTAQFHVCDFCWLWIKKGLLKLLTSLNDLLHLAHLCGFSPLWIVMCFLRVPALLNDFLHWVHKRGFSSMWVKRWLFRKRNWLNDFVHWAHVCIFSPLRIRRWFLRFPAWLKYFLHSEQDCSFSPL